jgi:hypothetical protein
MTRLIGGLLAILCLLGAAQGETIAEENFEEDLRAWTVGADLPEDPNNPGQKVAWEAGVSDERAYAGRQSLRLYIDGRQDDGTVWIERPVRVEPDARVEVSFRFWSPFGGTFNNLAYVVGYIGPRPPSREDDLERLAPVTEVGEWDLLSLKGTAGSSQADSVWVAVGFSVVWESEQTYFIDEVTVRTQEPSPTPVRAVSWAELKRWLE